MALAYGQAWLFGLGLVGKLSQLAGSDEKNLRPTLHEMCRFSSDSYAEFQSRCARRQGVR